MSSIRELNEKIDSFPTSILLLKQQLEQKLPKHKHGKGQLLLVFGGIAYLQTKEKDYYIPSNHYIWIPKKYTHCLMFNSQDLHIINIYFPDNSDSSNSFYDELGIYPVSKLLLEMLKFSDSWSGNFYRGSWEYEYLTTLKHLLPKENLRKFSIQLPTTEDVKLNAVIDFIKENLNETLTLEMTATKFGVSIRSLTRMFQNKLHISFIQYVKMLRVIRAMEILKDTDMTVSEVAYEVGYSSLSAFSNTFLVLTNMRPSEFKAIL
ncbi:AraC family transcriptional regulator [Myroides injenensis]|uniref:AraC family transcriptional regulator n=1 Tax=Myroides injenensis TaxID=1183151 RepID=UPI000288E44F|nr:AraC family transcriptional regulator [Myroides injenensis]